MNETFRILIPLDGSELSERIFPWARLLHSALPEVNIELLRCFEPPSTVYLIPELAVGASALYSESDLLTAMEEYLTSRAGSLDLAGTTTRVAMADPASEILARSEEFNLILMASHGRGGLGRWLLGSVTTKVTRGTTVPTLVVSGKCIASDAEHPPKIAKVMVAYDGSPASERAVFRAASLARGFGASVHLYQGLTHVAMAHPAVIQANQSDLAQARTSLQALSQTLEGVTTTFEVRPVSVSSGIVEHADEVGADLLVLGSHGKSGPTRWMIGSETEHVLQEAHCPVLVIH